MYGMNGAAGTAGTNLTTAPLDGEASAEDPVGQTLLWGRWSSMLLNRAGVLIRKKIATATLLIGIVALAGRMKP